GHLDLALSVDAGQSEGLVITIRGQRKRAFPPVRVLRHAKASSRLVTCQMLITIRASHHRSGSMLLGSSFSSFCYSPCVVVDLPAKTRILLMFLRGVISLGALLLCAGWADAEYGNKDPY